MSLVSVIVPCYNHAQYLSKALESVLVQTYNNWECIIINDGSTDNTKEVVADFCERDTRFRYLYQQNKGLANARNTGLKLSTGEYIQLLDADDAILKTKFEKQIALMESDSADICICDYRNINGID